MKKESSTNLQKCLGQKNLDSSSFEIPEISLAQLILEQFAVNKETYKILLDIIYGDEGKGNGISTISQTAQRLRNSGQKSISRNGQKEIIMEKMKYEYKGNIYNYVGVGKFKDSTGKWIDAIIYERDNHMYMREVTDFIDKFKKVVS